MRALAALLALLPSLAAATPLRVGSKQFNESVILGEIAARTLRAAGAEVEHRRQLGGTRILWDALGAGAIDVYPEYTGTLREEIFARDRPADDAALEEVLSRAGLAMTAPLGFDNTYALGMREAEAARLGIRRISDLRAHAGLRVGLSNELLDRADGWRALRERYQLPQEARGLEHELAYRGLASGAIDVTDLYSTDAEIRSLGLRVLEDDLRHFPSYRAVYVYRRELERRAPAAVAALRALAGRIPEARMIEMNARAKLEHLPEARIAADFLAAGGPAAPQETRLFRIAARTGEHLTLVAIAVLLAIVLAIPLGIVAAQRPRVGHAVLAVSGVLQTVPSLALLVLLIPLFGIGGTPAVVAILVYSLLPIVRNTHAGLTSIPRPLRESAEALGLSPAARLRKVELPLAMPAIMAGVQTSAVIAVGTATLGALIGAGGYGQPIVTGIRLADTGLVLEGAIPAALLALAVQGLFDLIARLTISPGLRLPRRD